MELKRLILSSFIIITLLSINIFAQVVGMRVMPYDELSTRADVIVRGRVKKVEKATYLGTYTQLVTLEVTDIIKGDSRLKELKVWSGSQVINASDRFSKNSDVLIFTVHEQTFYRLLNYQYGQFNIEGELLKGWREPKGPSTEPPSNGSDGASQLSLDGFNIIDKNYTDVRKDVENVLRNKFGEGKNRQP